jgi:hypothetical protein
MGGTGVKRVGNGLAVAAMALVISFLAAGCGSGAISGAVQSAASGAKSAASNLPTLTTTPALPTPTATPTAPVTSPTETVTVTVTPSTPTPTAAAPATSQPSPTAATTAAATSSGASLLWLWILLGALVVIGLVVWIARASGRRSAAAAGWRSAVADVYANGAALSDAVRLADRPGAPGYAAAQWAGLQARADDLAQELYRLRESAPGEEDRMLVEDTLVSVRALRSAMADEQAAGGPGSPESAQVHSRLVAFENALRALRAAHEQMPLI